jgi:hypothetical protein
METDPNYPNAHAILTWIILLGCVLLVWWWAG